MNISLRCVIVSTMHYNIESNPTYTREHGTIGHKQILRNARIRDDHEQLVAQPQRVQRAELLVRVVEHELGVVGQEGERAWRFGY